MVSWYHKADFLLSDIRVDRRFTPYASHCGLLKMFPIADILEMTFECPLNGDLLDSLCKGWFGLSKVLSVC